MPKSRKRRKGNSARQRRSNRQQANTEMMQLGLNLLLLGSGLVVLAIVVKIFTGQLSGGQITYLPLGIMIFVVAFIARSRTGRQ